MPLREGSIPSGGAMYEDPWDIIPEGSHPPLPTLEEECAENGHLLLPVDHLLSRCECGEYSFETEVEDDDT